MKRHYDAALLLITSSLFVYASAFAQLEYTPGTTEQLATEFVLNTVTHPMDDTVLKLAPKSITLSFPVPAVLMKLAVRDGKEHWDQEPR